MRCKIILGIAVLQKNYNFLLKVSKQNKKFRSRFFKLLL